MNKFNVIWLNQPKLINEANLIRETDNININNYIVDLTKEHIDVNNYRIGRFNLACVGSCCVTGDYATTIYNASMR